jgi:YtkA-like
MITHTGELPTFAAPAAADGRFVRPRLALIGAVALTATLATTRWARPLETTSERTDDTGIFASLGRRASHNHRFNAEVVASTPLGAGVHQSWTVQLTRRGHRRVSGARLTVRTWSPETGEVSTVTPRVRYVGGGRYRVDDVYFPRPGWWNVALVVTAATGTDSVAFNVVLPAHAPRLGPSDSASLDAERRAVTTR